ncbi:hypothetical protein RRG08_052996 [Elysia crispata]|uniref:Uncharacterized protein n=1 Tax=Elysia crispata TaxID=231223 RepID=A0AAE1D9Q4_9GAST|nr:hypothetical protein RRG08_052996 [Elysia crispata]
MGLTATLPIVHYSHRIDTQDTVPEIEEPAGVTALQDGWLVVSDWRTRSLHLVTPDGCWDRQLWRHPRGSGSKDCLCGVSVSGGVCVAVTDYGEAHVFDIS